MSNFDLKKAIFEHDGNCKAANGLDAEIMYVDVCTRSLLVNIPFVGYADYSFDGSPRVDRYDLTDLVNLPEQTVVRCGYMYSPGRDRDTVIRPIDENQREIEVEFIIENNRIVDVRKVKN